MGYNEGMSREQIMMVNLDEMVPADSECRVIDKFCDMLNMSELGFVHAEAKDEGRPAYPPEALLKLYLYGLLNRIMSSGQLSKEAKRNIEAIWLLNGLKPSKRTLCYFKENNKKALREVFLRFNEFYRTIGLFGNKTVALDSVKIKANNSKKRNHNRITVERTLKKTEERIDEYLALLDKADEADGYDEEHDLTSEQIKGILEKLNAKKAKFEDINNRLEESGETQISETDPESRCMKQGSGKGMDISYNTQVVTEEQSKMIVDYKTTNSGSDNGHLNEMGNAAKDFLQTDEITMLADTGYHDGAEMLEAEANGITCLIPKSKPGNQKSEEGYTRDKFRYDEKLDAYICPQNNVLTKKSETTDSNGDKAYLYANREACENCPHRNKCTKGKYRQLSRKAFQTEADNLDARFIKRKGEYKKRQEIIEHQFGTIKWVWGFDRYYTKGIEFAEAENALRFAAYNLRRAINILGVERLIEEICKVISSVFCHLSDQRQLLLQFVSLFNNVSVYLAL